MLCVLFHKQRAILALKKGYVKWNIFDHDESKQSQIAIGFLMILK